MKPFRLFLTVVTLLTLPFVGQAPRLAAEDVDAVELYKKVVKSCVFIVTPLKGGFAMGSGSLIDADKKLVLTNYHVVDEEKFVHVQFPVFFKSGEMMTDKEKYIERIPAGQAIKGTVLYRDKSRDLALVQLARIPAGTTAIPLAKKSPEVATPTWNIGSPGALKQVFGVTDGQVRSIGVVKMLVGGSGPDSVFEVRARMVAATNPTNPGDSGGPLFDKRGYQVAVTESGSRSASLVNNFVDVSEVRALLNEKKIAIKELSDEPDPKVEVAKKDPKKTDSLDPGPGKTPPAKDPVATTPPTKDPAAAASPEDEKAASDLLRRAKFFMNGEENRETYMGKLKDIVRKYPATTAAKDAKKLLSALN
jgi:Trypsin-like peptidase domain